MLYTTARKVARGVRERNSYLYSLRDLLEAAEMMETSSLYGRGLPMFNTDLAALTEELDNRKKGTRK